jgi:predicted branched-subunit amino acid permease
MSDLIEVRSRTGASTHTPRRKATALRFALAGIFVVLLLGAAQASEQQVVPTALAFATVITIIVAAFVGWERQVDAAESAGLVKHYDQHPE